MDESNLPKDIHFAEREAHKNKATSKITFNPPWTLEQVMQKASEQFETVKKGTVAETLLKYMLQLKK